MNNILTSLKKNTGAKQTENSLEKKLKVENR